MFWKAFRVTLGILAALVASYAVVIVVLWAWIDGWIARNTWVWAIPGSVVLFLLLEARERPPTVPTNLPDPRIAKAKTN